MHTPHFIVVRAESGARACDIVDKHLEGWGSEVNWYTVCGGVSENDDVFCLEQGRYAPTKIGVTSIQQVNAGLEGGASSLPKGENVAFNVLQHEWNSGDYAEVGVTRIQDKDETGKLWVVFVDMHS